MRYISIILFFYSQVLFAQDTLTQSIRGTVINGATHQSLEFVSVGLANSAVGVTTDKDGRFILKDVPLGRHTLYVSSVGYQSVALKEILVSSGKEVYLEIELMEQINQLNEVIVKARVNKEKALNEMSLIGSQMFSMEEASRFAGGMDDPARLVSNYAGVSLPSTSNNGISIRGNAPGLLQWKLEGVEVPNPNHFADIDVLGGGFLSALSSNVLGNSDFFIGAFPAEYSNAVSGVFDMRLRNGNNHKYQHTFQLGILGIDLASEGPISQAKPSSYIINYRYSTTGLLREIQNKKDIGGTLGYQDLNFKLNFPTQRVGTFSVWGTGLRDKVIPVFDKEEEQKYLDAGIMSSADQKSGAFGLSNRFFFQNRKSDVKSTVAVTHQGNLIKEEFYSLEQERSPRTYLKAQTTNLILSTALNHRFSSGHTNKTGLTFTHINYDMNLDFTPVFEQPLQNFGRSQGVTSLFSAYTQSIFNVGYNVSLTTGLNLQHLSLINNIAVEPRTAIKWQSGPKNSFAFGYGLHSRMEKPDVYFVKDRNGGFPNRNLDLTKSHHLMFSYTYKISEDMNLKIEPYFQSLFNVPVDETDSYSILNRREFYMTRQLVSSGKGKNYGVDFTFSKYLTDGMYYMFTASVFQSKYKAADDHWYNTRYNRSFIVNFLTGKEWMLGSNFLSINVKATTMGGQRYSPVDVGGTLAHPDKEVQYDQSKLFSQQFSPMFVGDFTISYRINRKSVAHTFAVKSVNATRQKDYIKHKYNVSNKTIEPVYITNSLFNLSYRIDF